MPEEIAKAEATPSLSPWGPLTSPVFRMLWGTWMIANICMWMNDVAAAWLMTSMTTTPLWVALVQSASTLPVFLLGLPSGALADILDRRRYFIMTQFWVAGVATLLALLPLVARSLHGGDAGTFTLLLASMGAGAIIAAMFLPRLRQLMARDTLVLRATLLQSVSTAVMAFAPNVYIAVPAMLLNGAAWISCANSLSVSAQLSLPDWVRARGMSMYQMAIMGASALGAALWGQVATLTSIPTGLLMAALSGAVAMLLAQRLVTDRNIEEDLTPSRQFKAPVTNAPPGVGQVVVTIEYLIDPARSDDFRAVMQESRRSRLRQGAREWELLRDVNRPGRFIEQIIDESWTEHLRRFDRVTASDVALRERKLAFHLGSEPPLVTRCVVEDLVRVQSRAL